MKKLFYMMLLSFLLIPYVFAAEENLYELKLYEIDELSDDINNIDNVSFSYLINKIEMINYEQQEDGSFVYYFNNKKIAYVYHDETINSWSIVIDVDSSLTYNDTLEYRFTNDDKNSIKAYRDYRILSNYDGIRLIFAEKRIKCDSICIESVSLLEKSNDKVISNTPTFSELSLQFDLKFSEINDYAKYKIIINNSSNKDYKIEGNSIFNNSSYLSYEYSYENNNKNIEKNSKKIMYVTITYSKIVPEDKFVNGSFMETNNLVLNLGEDEVNVLETIKNPKTGGNLFMLIIILIISIIISIILFAITKKKKYLSIFIVSIALLPLSIYALEKVQIKIASKVIINDQKHNVYVTNDYGWSTKQYLESNYVSYNLDENRFFIVGGEKYFSYNNGIKIIGRYKKGELVSTGVITLGKWCSSNNCSDIQDSTLDSSFYCETNNMCVADDFDELNFTSSFNDNWGSYVRFPTEFIMPDHDVYFVINDG